MNNSPNAVLVNGTQEMPMPANEKNSGIQLISAADVAYESPRWVCKPYFQVGKGTLIQGEPGTGKTAFMCAVAASITTGTPILGMPIDEPGNVLILSVEDDLPVLRGRIEAACGDLGKIFFVPNASQLVMDSPEIEQAIRTTNAKLIILDPIQAFLGAKVDMFRANETRPALAKLFDTCARNNCACAIVAHTSKNKVGKSAVNMSLGSVDIPAAMRSLIHILRNPDGSNSLVAVHIKCSNAQAGPSLVYEIGEFGGVKWIGQCDYTADDITTPRKLNVVQRPYTNEPLVRVFRHMIEVRPNGGFWSYADVDAVSQQVLGYQAYASTSDLIKRVRGPLNNQLQTHDGLSVTTGHKQGGERGIRIERVCQLDDGQITLPLDCT